MRVADIPVEMVRSGTNWRFVQAESEDLDVPMEQWGGEEIVDAAYDWSLADSVIYSGLVMLSTGQVVPTLCLKEALSPEYGGDYCWFVNGSWRQLGLDHVDGAEVVTGYTASPLGGRRYDVERWRNLRDVHRRHRFHRAGRTPARAKPVAVVRAAAIAVDRCVAWSLCHRQSHSGSLGGLRAHTLARSTGKAGAKKARWRAEVRSIFAGESTGQRLRGHEISDCRGRCSGTRCPRVFRAHRGAGCAFWPCADGRAQIQVGRWA